MSATMLKKAAGKSVAMKVMDAATRQRRNYVLQTK